jgi:hypothetical protein
MAPPSHRRPLQPAQKVRIPPLELPDPELSGQSYPLCFPELSFLQSPNVALTDLWVPPPLAAELAATGDPTIKKALARRHAVTRFAARPGVVER